MILEAAKAKFSRVGARVRAVAAVQRSVRHRDRCRPRRRNL